MSREAHARFLGGRGTVLCPGYPAVLDSLLYGSVWIDGKLAAPGTEVEVLTPREEVVGCFRVRESGFYGLVNVYGTDADGAAPGFSDGERLMLRANSCVPATLDISWTDDKAPHRLHISVVDGVCQLGILHHAYLPLVLKE